MRFAVSRVALGTLLLNLPLTALGVELTGYEYIVVGSGAGGGPLAARLALAGHKTLLIEAGDDKGGSYNYTVPAYAVRSSEDESMAWDFFVRHCVEEISATYQVVFREYLNPKTVSGADWGQFHRLSRNGHHRLVATIAVGQTWGEDLSGARPAG